MANPMPKSNLLVAIPFVPRLITPLMASMIEYSTRTLCQCLGKRLQKTTNRFMTRIFYLSCGGLEAKGA